MVAFKAVQKHYQRILVLDIPDLVLDSGVYWIQGRNGSGKTTLLKLLGGLLPFQGDIQVNGISQKKDPVGYRRQVSWSEAEPLYPAFLSGNDLINLYTDIRKPEENEARTLIECFQMKDYLSLPIGTYSSGMIKKLSLLLAFLGSCNLILLDEPLVTLDKETVPKLYQLVYDYHHNKKCSFLITSHQDFEESLLPIDKKLLVTDHHIKSYT